MAELIVLEQNAGEKALTEREQKVADLIMRHSGNDYSDVLRDAGWDVFYQLSSIRESILNWYPFQKNCQMLQLSSGFGALTGMLAHKARRLTVLEKSVARAECIAKRYGEKNNITIIAGDWEEMPVDEMYDYIIVEEEVNTNYELEELLEMISPFLKETGRMLFVCENRFGMKYWCGVPDPINGQPFAGIRGRRTEGLMTRQKLVETLEQSSHIAGWNIYYPFPNHKFAQAIYTDSYLPHASVRDRVIPYYLPEERASLVCLENEISDDLIANGVFQVFANSFLVECSKQIFTPEVIFAALSTDRGLEHGFATVIFNSGIVRKKILHPNGMKSLALIFQNQQELEQHGICCIRGKLIEDSIEMPFVEGSTLIEYLKELFSYNKKKVEEIFEKLYETILSSSEHVPFSQCAIKDKRLTEENAGTILKKAYIDMIPYNSFYKDGEILFYDQEFVKECFPAKYILFRALRYTYIYIPDAEEIIPLQFFKEKYGLVQVWQVFEQEEARFVEDNRNYEMLNSFYQWTGISQKQIDENIDKLKTHKLIEKNVPFKRHRYDLKVYKKDIKLNAVKAVQLQILRELDRVCRENDLSYCVFYGTLLGAVRHKGYIPWDDDVDILMPRADYDRLTLIASKVFPFPYFLQTPESDAECFYGGYGKLRKSNTTGLEKKNEGHYCNQGIWIDIFPLDFIPVDEKRKKEQQEKVKTCQRLLMKKTYPEKRVLWELTPEEEEDFLKMSRCLTREMLCQFLHNSIMDYASEKSDKVAILTRYMREKAYTEYDSKDFEFLIKRKFEDVEVYIPVGYENCLRVDYGENYALYPQESERVPHHNAIYDTTKSYIDYIRETGYNT